MRRCIQKIVFWMETKCGACMMADIGKKGADSGIKN